tara:strand:+ start:384 stop:698 length:315 start_codon:yes stop_codon:yes gene_type:complete
MIKLQVVNEETGRSYGMSGSRQEANEYIARMKVKFGENLTIIETDSESDDALHNQLAIQARSVEFSKIDINLMEALAEKELGNLAPMESYLAARKAIKDNNPKR